MAGSDGMPPAKVIARQRNPYVEDAFVFASYLVEQSRGAVELCPGLVRRAIQVAAVWASPCGECHGSARPATTTRA